MAGDRMKGVRMKGGLDDGVVAADRFDRLKIDRRGILVIPLK